MRKIIILFGILISSLLFTSCQKTEEKVTGEITITYNPEQRFVTDLENLLTPEEEFQLNKTLSDYEQKTSVEIAILTTDNYEDFGDIGDYAITLGEKWGVGKKDIDNGLMIVVSKANDRRFVATGYGLEGYLTDAFTKTLQDSILVPYCHSGEYYKGLTFFVDSCMSKIGTEYSAENNTTKKGVSTISEYWKWFVDLPLWVKLIVLGCYIALWFISPTLAWYITLLPLTIVTGGKFGGGKFGGGGSES